MGGTQHGAQLHHQHFRVIESYPDATPAEEGVGFVDGKIGQILVATDIEGPHHHRQRGKALQLVAIEACLLLLTGELLRHHKGHFGAVKPHATDTLLQRCRSIDGQSGVDHQRHGVAIGRLARQILFMLKQFNQGRFFGDQAAIARPQLIRGAHEQAPTVAIEHHFGPREARQRQIHHAQHSGNPHGAGDDRYMGGTGAAHRHQADKALAWHFRQGGNTDLVAYQHGVFGEAGGQLRRALLQVRQHSAPQIAYIGGPLTQVVVIDPLQILHMASYHIGQCPRRPLTFADPPLHFLGECRFAEHLLIDLEQRQLLRRDTVGQALPRCTYLFAHTPDSLLEAYDLMLDVGGYQIGHAIEISQGRDDFHLTDSHAG